MNFVKKLIFIVSLIAVQLSVKIDAQTEGCGGTYTNLSGTISSPNYPSNYGNNLNCYYYIQRYPPNYVNITFMSFETQLSVDWLQVSCSSDALIPVRTFSGSSLPSPLSIPPCTDVLLQFHTDGSEVYQGFRLTYNIYNGCGGTFSGLSGTISSPNYPSNYSNNLNCNYYIQRYPPNYVNITFTSFQTESSFDSLQVNCSSDALIPVRTFSGSSLPSTLSIPPCSNILLQFHTDGTEVYQGFRLTYNIYNGCGGTYAGQSGIISSPNYPSNYGNYLNCSYYIQIPPPNYVNITFISFATESYYDWLQVSCTSDSTKPVQKFGGKNLPPFLSISSCSTVQLLFLTDVSVVDQGFRLRYDIGDGLEGGLTMKPMNVYVRNDSVEPIVLSCSSKANQPDAYPWWTYISNYNPNVEMLTTSNCSVSSTLRIFNSAYLNTTRQYSSRTCNLTISRSYLSPATGIGLYTCTDSTLDFFSVLMTYVVPSFKFVNLNSTTEVVRNDEISVTCSVQVSQKTSSVPQLVPSVYLYSNDNQYPIKVSNSTVSFNVSASPDILPFGCEINFTYSRNFSAGYATNMPQSISFMTEARQVLYWPENKTILIKGDNSGKVAANGNLTCFVPANPPVTYQWAEETTNRLWKGSTIAIERNGSYTCTATNIIRGIPYEASKSINITVINDTGNNLNTLALIIGVVVGTAVLIIIVVAIIVFFCLRRKKIPPTPVPAATTNVDPQNDNLYERSRRNTMFAEEGEDNEYEMIDYKTRE